ncbi:amino acid adenylation domain-containing protein [Streptomyces sp. NBC_00237]|uniref:non-ribosomal peptide synthetase n=1 Tax=Streptomyces sp. NBC_00237 TaxID=2975687 RepID=UPI0022545D78|nr:non-ribosomal peptide synthetase [Streptomyces sp. NBC_00237]MCX5202739.1 amino acid adenylation domain-containing protein [Streptomyces sp. NBC_00237]
MSDLVPLSGIPAPGLAAAVLDRARRHPTALALVDGARRLDYAELDRRSAAVAEALRARGVRPGQAVALRLPRSWQLVCAMLGALRLGATVVPLDAQSPPERRRHIVSDSASVAVVLREADSSEEADRSEEAGSTGGLGELPPGVAALTIESLLQDASPTPCDPPSGGFAPSFLFYTSGSTGRPKGVEVHDAGILRLARPGYLRLDEGMRFACLSNPAFDALSFEVWTPLLTGGCCVIVDDDTAQSPDALAAATERLGIDVLFITVALFNAVVEKVPHCFATIGQVLVGGEQLNAPLIRRWYRHNHASATRLHNVYGPTEATTFALCHPVPRDFTGDLVPIGRPLPGTGAVAVVDGSREAECGEVAELLLSGDALAAGYRNLPEETALRFTTLPWYDGGVRRHYRTGDLVHRDDEGRYTYVERADRQVKVRGFRIEPGELERCLLTHPAVRQAYVCTRRDAHGVNELLAHLVLGSELSYDAFEQHVSAGLPAYMRPHRTYLLTELPLNANGKVDRDALAACAGNPWRGDDGRTDGDLEEGDPTHDGLLGEVLQLASDVTGVDDLRGSDRWIAVGGDSLKALRLRYEVRRRWGVEVPQARVLAGDLAGLASTIEAGLAPGRAVRSARYPVPAAPSGAESAPATAEQQRLWLLQQQDPASRAYHVPLAFDVAGEVDADALRRALRDLVVRHPALRTAFEATPGGLRQVVGEPYDPWCEPSPGAASGFFDIPFDLARPELFRACWLPRPDGGELLLSLHHIAVDGWSLSILFGELSAGYVAARGGRAPLPDPGAVPTPLDYADWQAEWFTSDAYRSDRSQLRAKHVELMSDTEDSPDALEPVLHTEIRTGRLLRTTLDAGRREALDRLCGQLGLTRFQVLLGVYAWSLYGVTGRTRLRMAAPVANRPVREFSTGVGMFANTVVIPVELGIREELRPLLARLGSVAQDVLALQDVALADALHDGAAGRGGSRGTPFDFLFVLENTDFGALAFPDCRVLPQWPQPADAKCPLTLSVVERGVRPGGGPGPGSEGALDCLWEYDARFFATDAVTAMSELFRDGLDRLLGEDDGARPRPRGGTLAELVAPYRERLPEPGRARPMPADFVTVAEGFARQVGRTPDAPALVGPERTLTYRQLDAYTQQLAAELSREFPLSGAEDGDPCVALHFAPSETHVVALLALARLRLTVVPLDPSYPPELLRQILGQLNPLCVLVPEGGADALDGIAPDSLPRRPVKLAAHPPSAPEEPGEVPEDPDGRHPLYLLFTSGSTGVPKGVRVPDRTLCNLLQWQRDSGGLAEAAVTQQFSMLSFDVSFQEVFSTLCGGGRLHLVDPRWRQDAPALLDQLEASGAERLFLPYVALHLLAEHGVRLGRYPSRLREVVTAGEQLLCTDAIRRWFAGMPGARLFNHYGPSETHVVSALCLEGDPADWPQRPAIGRPVAGAWLRVVDEADAPVPPGMPGRLLIGGPMAAPCYAGDAVQSARLNAERFVDLPGLGTFYRSGDLAHFDHEGLLHYRGRDDQQIKLSGHRLELGQVEAALLRHPDVVNAVVAVQVEPGSQPAEGTRLVACLQLRDPDSPPDQAELARHLAPLLPSYVRVDRFRVLERLPLAPSGKLDRRAALTAPGVELGVPRATALAEAAPRAAALSAREARLTKLFEEVLGLSPGPDERFFDAGASSLGLMRFHLRCTAEPELRFSIPDLFEHVTVRRLAAHLDDRESPTRPRGKVVEQRTAEHDESSDAREPIAVVGMAVRVPGADDLAAFWKLIRTGGRGMEHFEAPEGVVGVRSQMSELLSFDAEHFGISRQEARLMDPQQRHLLMSCVQALAHAGIGGSGAADARRAGEGSGQRPGAGQRSGEKAGPRIGLVAGCGENTYFQSLLREADPERLPDGFQLALHHEKDFLTTKVAYHLDLAGPAFTVQAACASSLVAVHVAAGLLRQGDADVMLAGGVLVDTLLTDGYAYRPQHIFSADGHCRGFSDDASGTVGASGVGVVVLKPLRLARRDGDTVYAVLTGSALNNDGAGKLSYSAPSLAGQRDVIRAALRRSGRSGADLGYVEAHGTGTPLGDPVEVGALRQAFGEEDAAAAGNTSPACAPASVALASVKSQIGHLGAAAGVVGLVRAVLAIHHAVIPPQVDFHRLNPQIGPDAGPFFIPTEARAWPVDRPRVAAVSSFGIGGTNAHVVLEAGDSSTGGPAPEADTARSVDGTSGTSRTSTADAAGAAVPCVVLSSSSAQALRTDAARIAAHLRARPETYDSVVRHLRAGRPARRLRVAAVCADAAEAAVWLDAVAEGTVRPVEAGVPDVADDGLSVGEHAPGDLVAAWLAGRFVRWSEASEASEASAQAPWDFPPPAFALTTYDASELRRTVTTGDGSPGTAAGEWPERVGEAGWLHQPHWVRRGRAGGPGEVGSAQGLLVVMTDEPLPEAALRPFRAVFDRVVGVVAAEGFARLGEDAYAVDAADCDSLRQLFDALVASSPVSAVPGAGPVVDWLHALPLGVGGAVDDTSLDRARRACLDTPAALLRAAAELSHPVTLRPWWLSYAAQPVEGPVRRPELGLLAGAAEVAAQECAVDARWLDLPSDELDCWAAALAGLLAERVQAREDSGTERRLALRQGYWWRQAVLPVPVPEPTAPSVAAFQPTGAEGPPTYVVLGGTGGIGSALAAQLLVESDACRLVLVSRRAALPEALAPWADRVDLVEADLGVARVEDVLGLLEGVATRIDGVVHAVGLPGGGLLTRRDSAAMRPATEGKLRGALLVERLIERHRPAFAVYCSSMSALFGGVGQFDYAAANGLLDGFAGHRSGEGESTLRIALGWDVWREGGMAGRALHGDARHHAHLAVGLTDAEGRLVFARALRLQLPHLLVSTTDIGRAAAFYAPPQDRGVPKGGNPPQSRALPEGQDRGRGAAPDDARGTLTGWLGQWLGLDAAELDPEVSLYDYGADSLTMIDLIAKVEQHFGVDLELSRLSHRVSVEELLGHLPREAGAAPEATAAATRTTEVSAEFRSVPAPEVTLEVWQEGTGTDLVCLVHPVGGDIQAYRDLVSALDPHLTVCLVADPFLRGSAEHGPGVAAWSLAERARRYHAALQERFPHGEWRWQLAGWSFGAWVAHAMAAEAEAAGRPAEGLHLLDPPPPDGAARFLTYDDDEKGIEAVFAYELGQGRAESAGGTASQSPRAQAYAARLAVCCRANLAAMARHVLPRLAATPAHLWLAGLPVPGLPEPDSVHRQLIAWKAELPFLKATATLDTTHYGIVRPPHVRPVADAVNTAASWSRTDRGDG